MKLERSKVAGKQSEEFIYNWNNQLTTGTHRERLTVLVREAQSLKNRGFERDEALDIIAADSQDLTASENAVDYVYAGTVASEVRQAQVTIVPTSYDDIKVQVEQALERLGPQGFISALCDSSAPIIRTSNRGRGSLVRLAESALQMNHAMGVLHDTLQPYFETVMLDSVMLAENMEPRIAQKTADMYEVEAKGDTVSVDVTSGQSDSERYTDGRFAEFGLACEYMVRVADHVSPHERLRRAVNS
ncbi:MAG: hypothetical protein JSS66_05225 [Armatimonadetes bacterium]|nr:hypothetical protein [Armatimonadota bacterium]